MGVIMSTIVKEVIATLILVTTGVVMAGIVHFSILIFLSCKVARKVLTDAINLATDVVLVLKSISFVVTEVSFHCLGMFVAMVIAVFSYAFIFSVLCAHAMYTVAMVMKRSKRRKRYFRRLIKVVTYVGFVVCLTYVVRERTTVVMETTEEFGKTTFALVLGYMISGRSPPSQT